MAGRTIEERARHVVVTNPKSSVTVFNMVADADDTEAIALAGETLTKALG